MAVKTSFSAENLQAILAGYNEGDYVGSKGFDRGADQTNIRVTTSNGTYAFRYYEKRPVDYVRFEIDLLHFLGSKCYLSPAPIQRRDGSYFGMYNVKPYAMFTLLDGEHDDNPNNYRLVAPALAQLHTLTRGHRPAYADARTPYGAGYAWSCAETNAKHIADQAEAEARLVWFRAELDSLEIPDELPQGVCHCDTNPSNFLYQHGRLSAVLDFDQASYTWLLYDLAQLIYWWTWPNKGSLQLEQTRDLVAHYETVRQLSEAEKRHLFDVLKLVHLVGIGWSLSDDSFPNDQRKVIELNELGRERFYDAVFG